MAFSEIVLKLMLITNNVDMQQMLIDTYFFPPLLYNSHSKSLDGQYAFAFTV